jgi:hypothetical protein
LGPLGILNSLFQSVTSNHQWEATNMKEPAEHERNALGDSSEARTKRLLLDAHRASMLAHRLALIDIEGQFRLAQFRSHYNPNEPRVPKGHPDGGQWTREATGAAAMPASQLGEQLTPTW